MKKEDILNALDGLDDATLEEVAEVRNRAMQIENTKSPKEQKQKPRKNRVRWMQIGTVAVAAMLVMAVAMIPVFHSENDPSTVAPIPIETVTGKPSEPVIPSTTAAPQYTNPPFMTETTETSTTGAPDFRPNYATPTVEEIFDMEEFAPYFPRQILDGFTLDKTYMTVYDPIANPKNEHYLSVTYVRNNGTDCPDTLQISFHMGSIFADFNNPDTYELHRYYEKKKAGASGEDLPYVFGMLRVEDVTRETVNHKVYNDGNGNGVASIHICFGETAIDYSYGGTAITADAFYNMIVSADYFQK